VRFEEFGLVSQILEFGTPNRAKLSLTQKITPKKRALVNSLEFGTPLFPMCTSSPSLKKLPTLTFTKKIIRPEACATLSLPLSEPNYETVTEPKISVRFLVQPLTFQIK